MNTKESPLVSAIWKDTTIATSDETVIVEGNHYFPPSGVDLSLLEMSPHTSVCPIKGAARFFHVRAGDALNVNAAWTYPPPLRMPRVSGITSLSGRRGRCLADWTDDFADSHAGADISIILPTPGLVGCRNLPGTLARPGTGGLAPAAPLFYQ